MTREEKLKKLHTVDVGVDLTAWTEEWAFECKIITPKGCKYEWISLDSWLSFRLEIPDREVLNTIREKLESGSLEPEDLGNTDLVRVYNAVQEEDPSVQLYSLFDELQQFVCKAGDSIYTYYCEKYGKMRFFTELKEFLEDFSEHYIGEVTPWEELQDDELDEWLQLIPQCFQQFPFIEFEQKDVP